MYERTNYLAVGVFILIGTLALVAVGFWIGGVGQTVPMSRYTVIFERDVNGLSEGSMYRAVENRQVLIAQERRTFDESVLVDVFRDRVDFFGLIAEPRQCRTESSWCLSVCRYAARSSMTDCGT